MKKSEWVAVVIVIVVIVVIVSLITTNLTGSVINLFGNMVTYNGVLKMLNKCEMRGFEGERSCNEVCGEREEVALNTYVAIFYRRSNYSYQEVFVVDWLDNNQEILDSEIEDFLKAITGEEGSIVLDIEKGCECCATPEKLVKEPVEGKNKLLK